MSVKTKEDIVVNDKMTAFSACEQVCFSGPSLIGLNHLATTRNDMKKCVVNKQQKNVGNLGDTLKHAPLTGIGCLFDGDFAYVETHAFLPVAPLACRSWRKNVMTWVKKHEVYDFYRKTEEYYVEHDLYKCSSSIVMSPLAGSFTGRVFLAESNSTTRACLENTYRERHINLYNDYRFLCTDPELTNEKRVFMLVDPFGLDQVCAENVVAVFYKLVHQGAQIVMQCFDHGGAECSNWNLLREMTGPSLRLSPVVQLDVKSYHNAVFCDDKSVDRVVELYTKFGWKRNF